METHTHISEVVQTKTYRLRLLHLRGGPLPLVALFQAVLVPYFFLCNWDRGFFNPTVEKYSAAFITLSYKKIATVVQQQQDHSILGQHLYQGHPNFFLIYDRMKQNSSQLTRHRYMSILMEMSQYASWPMRYNNTMKGFLNTRQE